MRAGSLVLQSLGLVGLSQMAPKFQVPVTLGGSGVDSSSSSSSSSQRSSQQEPSKSWAVRCPFDFKAKDAPADGIYGVGRVSRHASMWSFGSVGAGMALATPLAPSVVMFTFPIIFAAIGTAHQDYRFRRGWGGQLTPDEEAKTSNIPFGALLTGRQSWSKLSEELKWTNAAIAVGFAAIVALRRGKGAEQSVRQAAGAVSKANRAAA